MTRVDPSTFIASSAVIRGRVSIGANAVILFGVVIRAEEDEVVIGDSTNIQDNSVVHCDMGFPTRIGARTTVGHGAIVHGASIGDGCLVGIGATALNGSRLGEGAWLAAGGVLTEGRSIPAWTLAAGVPARPIRPLTDEEIERQRSGILTYLELGEQYRRAGDGQSF
jgi:carbonic anhydrase/acetyltransferase-like protein (isoleucine patch superfamily)